MSKLFVSNFDFEDELAGRRGSRTAWQSTRGLSGCWTPLLGPGDRIVAGPLMGSGDPCEAVRVAGEMSGATQLVPWGWSAGMARLAQEIGAAGTVPDVAVVEMINRRRWSHGQELELGLAPEAGRIVSTFEDCRTILSQEPPIGTRWLVKPDLGASGRHQLRMKPGAVEAGRETWLAECLERDGLLLIEPWLDAVCECSLQFEVRADDTATFLGVTELLTTASGGYLGTRFGPSVATRLGGDVGDLVATVRPVVERASRLGYVGPMGVDAMRYRPATGEPLWRPLQDINARYTMGRCALEWSDVLPGGVCGTVLVGDWAGGATWDRGVERLVAQVDGLERVERYSPVGPAKAEVKGLVLVVYAERVEAEGVERAVLDGLEGA